MKSLENRGSHPSPPLYSITPPASSMYAWEKINLKEWEGGGMIEMHNICPLFSGL